MDVTGDHPSSPGAGGNEHIRGRRAPCCWGHTHGYSGKWLRVYCVRRSRGVADCGCECMYVCMITSCRLPAARPAVGREVPRSHPSPSAATAPATAAPRHVPHRQRHAGNALGRLGAVTGARGPPSGPGAPRLASHAYPAPSDGSATAHAGRHAVAGKLPHTTTHTQYTPRYTLLL